MTEKMKITFRKERRLSGTAGVFQSAREPTHDICINGVSVGTVQASDRNGSGYFWYVGDSDYGVRFKNTSRTPAPDLATAKAECKAYVLECLKAKGLK